MFANPGMVCRGIGGKKYAEIVMPVLEKRD